MINVNQITSQLAKMPDQLLQKFAAMHKNDPYTVSLALAESNRRKELRSGAQARMAGQQQPKVVDQEVAQMASVDPMGNVTGALPEEVGIGQLPAQNLRKLAGGGIVAFEEGGEVPRFQDRGLVQLPGGIGILSQGAFGPQAGAPENLTWAQRKMDEIAAKVEAGTASPQEKAWLSMFGGAAKERASLRQQQALYQNAPNQMGGETARLQAANKAAAPTTAVAPDGSQTTPGGTPPAAPPAAQPAMPGLPGIAGYKKELEAAINKNAPTKEQFQQEFSEIDKPLLDKMKAGIDKERNRLESDKEQDFYMALIQGGLAAAAESGPNALQNIAKGLSTGAGSYKEALKDFRKATQENTKMEMEMARYEASGKKDALKSYYDAQAKRDDRYAAGLTTLMAQQVQTQGQIAAAGMPSGTERLISRIGTDPKFAAAYEKYAAMGPNAKLPNQILAKYADPKELMKLKVMDPDLYEQVKAQLDMAAGLGGGVPRPINQPLGNARP